MTQLLAGPLRVAGWVAGLVQDADAGTLKPGTIVEGENLVPTPVAQMETRGGSRIMLTLLDDAGTPAELTHVCVLWPFTPTGAAAIGWSDGQNKHYIYRLTADMAIYAATMALTRTDLTAAPSSAWNNGSAPARPQLAELFEKLFIADATVTYANRNTFLSMDSAGTILQRTFAFGSGAAQAIRPYCLEEYNNVLFIAGYGSEDANDADRPELVRHSFLGKSPDAADGFDPAASQILGAKGQRVTGMRKGRGLLLAAKDNELYRITGFGRAYVGWQYVTELVTNSAGLGVANPHAFRFFEQDGVGYWYGIGKGGPFRTDGFATEDLTGPRQRGWRAMNHTDTAWVSPCPRRGLILFGLHPSQASSGRSASYPWTVWAWDIARDVWAPDHKLGADLFHGVEMPGATIAAPAGPPTAPSSASVTASGWTANWTTGDGGAETEYWQKTGSGGTWALAAVIAAGTSTKAITGQIGHQNYYWKVRHRIGSVQTDFTSEVQVQTLIPAPVVDDTISTKMGVSGAPLDITITVAGADTLTLEVETSAAGAGVWSVIASAVHAAGQVHVFGGDCGQDVRAICRDAAWSPAASSYSATSSTDCSGVP